MRRRIVLAVAFLVAVSGLAVTSGTAEGATPTPTGMSSAVPSGLPSVVRHCTADTRTLIGTLTGKAVLRRQNVLKRLDTAVAQAKSLSAAHRDRIDAITGTAGDGLAAVTPSVQSADGCTAAISLAKGIVTDFRVYGLVAPQVRLAVAGDTGAAAAAQLTAVLPALKLAVAALPAGDTKTQAQSLLSDYGEQATAAAEAFAPVADAVLVLRPADYPGNRATLQAQTKATARGAQALAVAADDAEHLATLLTA